MDITGFFGKEVFRPIVITLVPGIFASAPFLTYLHGTFEVIPTLVSGQAAVAAILALALIIASGFLMENIGSWIEVFLCNIHSKAYQKNNPGAPSDDDIWYSFLATNFEKPPIGIHYLESIVLRLKFETSMVAPLMLLLFWVPFLTKKPVCDTTIVAMEVGLIALIGWLLYESYEGCALLDKLRRKLLQGVDLK